MDDSDESDIENDSKSKKSKRKNDSDTKEENEENESSQKSEDEKTKRKKEEFEITDYPNKQSEEEMNQIDENSLYQNNIICKKFIETKDFLKDISLSLIKFKFKI